MYMSEEKESEDDNDIWFFRAKVRRGFTMIKKRGNTWISCMNGYIEIVFC